MYDQYNITHVNIIFLIYHVVLVTYLTCFLCAWIRDFVAHLEHWMVILVPDRRRKTGLSQNEVLWIKHDKQIRMDERAEGWRRESIIPHAHSSWHIPVQGCKRCEILNEITPQQKNEYQHSSLKWMSKGWRDVWAVLPLIEIQTCCVVPPQTQIAWQKLWPNVERKQEWGSVRGGDGRVGKGFLLVYL